ncbi:MAG TPA: hypothetical protein VJU53_07785 [Burkholderiaceae bacterium]|nr:hypothetical protein [Burkholderiaceae bacterium]
MNTIADPMSENNGAAESVREPLLNPVDRVSEMLFGLFMALTFTGAVSIANSGHAEIQEMLAAAIGCNLAWGLVDAVMYVVRTITDRGRALTLIHSVKAAADIETGRALIKSSLSNAVGSLVTNTEIEAIRGRVVALQSVPDRPHLKWNDLLAALVVFLLVVAATFPVVLPFVVTDDVGLAKNVSRAIALTMLFFGGIALGRYAGYGSWKVGFMMAGLGTALIAAVMALGG